MATRKATAGDIFPYHPVRILFCLTPTTISEIRSRVHNVERPTPDRTRTGTDTDRYESELGEPKCKPCAKYPDYAGRRTASLRNLSALEERTDRRRDLLEVLDGEAVGRDEDAVALGGDPDQKAVVEDADRVVVVTEFRALVGGLGRFEPAPLVADKRREISIALCGPPGDRPARSRLE